MSLALPAKAPVAEQPARPARLTIVQRRVADDDKYEDVKGRCACGGGCPRCQAKTDSALSISTPGDYFEREADRAADSVTASLHGGAAPVAPAITSLSWNAGGASPSSTDSLMRAEDGQCAGQDSSVSIASRLDAGATRGAPLSQETREKMEHGLGADFSGVRIHADSDAHQLTQDVGARAFTHGPHVYFRSGEFQPGTERGDWLIAHELTHVVQQSGASSQTVHRVQRLPTLTEAWTGVRTTVRSGATVVRETVRSGVDTVREAAGTVSDTVVDVARSARDLVEGYLEEHAPGVLAFIRGDIVGEIKRRIYNGLDYLFSGLGARIQTEGLSETARSLFGEFVDGVNEIASDLGNNRCESLFAALRMIGRFGERLTGPAFAELREFASNVSEFFSDLWNDFGAEPAAAIQSMAGDVWTWITEHATWLWEQTEGVRTWLREAWASWTQSVRSGWDSAGNLLAKLREKAVEAWAQIRRELGPWLLPLQIAVAALVLFSPLGPIAAVAIGGYALWEVIGWIRAHWDDIEEAVINARQYLHDHVLPHIMSGIEWLRGAIEAARQWVHEQATNLVNALESVIDALGLTPALNALRRLLTRVARGFVRVVRYISTEVRNLFGEIRRIALQVHQRVRPFYGLIAAIILFPQYPFLLPIVLTGWAWQLSPDCLKPPIIDFALDTMIRAIRGIPEFRNLGEAWPHARAEIIRTLEQVRGMDYEEKVAASNRTARIMTGQDIEWIFTLVGAARNAPSHFTEQMEEEVGLSMLDEVLPFERTSIPTRETRRDAAIASADLPVGDADVLTRTRVGEDDLVIENVPDEGEIDPQLEEDLNLAEGQETAVMGGEARSFDDVRADLAGVEPEPTAGPGPSTAPDPRDAADPAPETTSTDTTAVTGTGDETERRLQEMIDRPLDRQCEEEPPGPAATQSDFPEALKFGPLTRGQRARFLVAQMGKQFTKWLRCNAHWLIPTVVVALAALIAVEILTEGAITAALPAIFDIIAAIFIGYAVVRAGFYVGRYVYQAFAGETENASKSLARAFAVAAIELLFALLFNLGAVIDAVRGGMRGIVAGATNAARNLVRTTTGAFRTLGRTASRGASAFSRNLRGLAGAVVRNGRVSIRGLRNGFSRGVRTFRQLLDRLAHMRFRGFSIRRANALFIVYAHINPRYTIATMSLRLREIRAEIAAIVEEAEVVVRQGRGVYRRYIDLSRADRDLIAAVLRRNRGLIRQAREARRAGRLGESVLDDFLFRIEGHHAVPRWMGGPHIPYQTGELLGMCRVLHNFDPSGFHTVMRRFWAESPIFGHIAVDAGDAVRAMFRGVSPAEHRRLINEIRRILTRTYRETLGPGPALTHALEVMEEGLQAFRF